MKLFEASMSTKELHEYEDEIEIFINKNMSIRLLPMKGYISFALKDDWLCYCDSEEATESMKQDIGGIEYPTFIPNVFYWIEFTKKVIEDEAL